LKKKKKKKTSSTKFPLTSSFISFKSSVATFPLGCPIELLSKKKLFPTSAPSVFFLSIIVKDPIPGRTRFFNVSVPTALALIKQTLASSSACCPLSPQSLFFFFFFFL